MTPAVTPIARRKVEKARKDKLRLSLKHHSGWNPCTIDFVLHFLPVAHESSIDPVPGKHKPSDNAESIPAQVHQRGFSVPKTFPKFWVLENVKDFRVLDRGQRGWTSILLGTSKVKQIRHQWDPYGY